MIVLRRLWWCAALACAAGAYGQVKERTPHIGYFLPAGGRQGTVVRVLVGGQFLAGCDRVRVAGPGVHATVFQVVKPLDNMKLGEIRKTLAELVQRRRAAGGALDRPETFEGEGLDLPDHPLLRGVATMSVQEIEAWMSQFLNPEKRQPNAQIAELVEIEVTIDADAPPGDRELRLGVPAGLTNPLRFQVGALPELAEHEPNDRKAAFLPVADLPVLFNGRIMPGDVDRFRFRARKGQAVVLGAQARRLIPYLADAVPGWFQATLSLYDADGRELAYDDDWRFDPDPVLACTIPADGEYELEIRDALYRGREDFVYRVTVGEQPFITQVFPLGGQEGKPTVAAIAGRNLPGATMPLDTTPGGGAVREAGVVVSEWSSNRVAYAVDDLPEEVETEPNDDDAHAQVVELPLIVNGRIGRPGDVDAFRFEGKAGATVVAEVSARRLGSPLDSLLRLLDAAGKTLAWNDDLEKPETGLITHQADSRVSARLPADGTYTVLVADAERHGDDAFGYRLRLGPPRPDFAIRIAPSTLNVPAAGVVPFDVHVLRKDGFDGEIELALVGADAGFTLSGGRIPRGKERVRMTLTAPRESPAEPVALQFEGRAELGGETVRRPATPAEDLMQAFLYRHLVPALELLVVVPAAQKRSPGMRLADPGPVRLPAGGTVRVQVRLATPRAVPAGFHLELDDPPPGVTLAETTAVPGGYDLVLAARADAVKAGFADNLIVEVWAEAKPAKEGQAPRRVWRGVLPAIAIEVVGP